jgi:hypothetical protein
MGTGDYFPRSEVAGVWTWSRPSPVAEVTNEWSLYLHSPCMPLWPMHRSNFTYKGLYEYSQSNSNTTNFTRPLKMWNSVQKEVYFCLTLCSGRGSSVSIVTRLRVGQPRNRGLIPFRGKKFLLTLKMSRPSPRANKLPVRWVLGAPSPEIKRLGHKADYSPPSSAEVKNERSCTSTPPSRPLWLAQSQLHHYNMFFTIYMWYL